MDRKSDLLDKKDEILEQKRIKIEERQQQVVQKSSVQTLIMKHEQELERISGLTQEAVMNNFNELKKNCLNIAILVKEKEKSERKK